MLIQCTKKVLDRMHLDSRTIAPKDHSMNEFFCWHANIITINRRKVLIFVNNRTRMVIICYRPKPSVYKKMDEYLTKGIRELFGTLGVHSETIDLYLQKAGTTLVTSSGTRSQIARIMPAKVNPPIAAPALRSISATAILARTMNPTITSGQSI